MSRIAKLSAGALAVALLAGCASVPMATEAEDSEAKRFSPPPANKAGVYIYRNKTFGSEVTKTIYIDGEPIGESAAKTFFYELVEPGERRIATESEFGENDLVLQAEAGQTYYVRQYIKIGLFEGRAGLELVSEYKGKKGVRQCKLAE